MRLRSSGKGPRGGIQVQYASGVPKGILLSPPTIVPTELAEKKV